MLFLSYRLYSHVEGHEPALLIIKTVDEEVTLDNILNIGVHWIMFADMLCLTLHF